MNEPIIRTQGLCKQFSVRSEYHGSRKGLIKAVDAVDLDIRAGEILGLVGESGSGKTTLGQTILHLLKPDGGKILYRGKDIANLSHNGLRRLRRNMQIVFQDPYSSLEPRMKVAKIIGEGLDIHKIGNNAFRKEKVMEMMEYVGLDPNYISRYPHEFSGGQRQRISLARALVLDPEFLVADEPVSALDVSVQAQIINLFVKLKQQFQLTLLFISHDLAVVKHISDRIAVMYLGRIMELAPKKGLYDTPRHPYTKALLAAVPVPDPARRHPLVELEGDLPSPLNPPPGCVFATRCPLADNSCNASRPELREIEQDHFIACFKV